jgi:S1-C subfamily serine protease
MALLHPKALDTVVAIGKPQPNNKKRWIGTGFLYGLLNESSEDGKKSYRVFLVTNKHVLRNLTSIFLKFNPQNDQASIDFPIKIKKDDGTNAWFGHPDAKVDVAVLAINLDIMVKHGAKFEFIRSDGNAFVTSELMEAGISEGDSVYALGFPMGIVDTDRQYVIVRQGCIARIRDLYEKRKTDFLCDVMVFPGNSGGPVFIKPDVASVTGSKPNQKSGLIGIVKGYIPYKDVAVSQQTQRPRITFEENSGLTAIEPVDHIHTTIEGYVKAQEAQKKS